MPVSLKRAFPPVLAILLIRTRRACPAPPRSALGLKESRTRIQRADSVCNGNSLDYLEKHADGSEDFWSAVEEGGEEAVAGEEAKVSRRKAA